MTTGALPRGSVALQYGADPGTGRRPTSRREARPDSRIARAASRSVRLRDPQAELSALLRAWRGRLTPADLPVVDPYPRRRKQIVSQYDIAYAVGSTPYWYGELERGNGRGRHTDDYLDRVAAVLRLSDCEREVLYRLAVGRAPAGEQKPADPPQISSAMSRLVHSQPYPCMVVDNAFAVRAHNARSENWFPWLRSDTPNLMRWAFIDPSARQQLDRWEEDWVPALLAQLRLAYIRDPENRALIEVIRDIMAANEMARWRWDNLPSVEETGTLVRGVRVTAAAPVKVGIVSCSPEGGYGIRMLTMVPIEPTNGRP
jgi:hypothetical protein